MAEFEHSSKLGIVNEDVEPSSDAWNREWKSSRQVRSLESGMEELEPSSVSLNQEWRSSSIVRSLESEMKVSSQVSDT